MPARILEAVARLVGELAEVHLPRVRRLTEHEDVGAGTEHPIPAAGDDDRAHARMLEANALHRVVKLDVDAEVIAVELELVAFAQSAVFVDGHRQRRDRTFDVQPPMAIALGVGFVVDRGSAHVGLSGTIVHLTWIKCNLLHDMTQVKPFEQFSERP